jgi:hypothetical protein
LRALAHHLRTFWEARDCPNVVLLHYDELKTDLEGQMRRLADRLGITVPNGLWPDLVQGATFEQMRTRADEIVPNATAGLWYDNALFFNKGTSGQWREALNADDLRMYRSRVTEIATPELIAWMHQGSIC